MQTTNTKIRSSNFELLRIISMIFIIAHHYSCHGAFSFDNTIEFNRLWVQWLYIGGKLGVNCFVLITGYFSFEQKFRTKSIILFILQVTLFSVVINVFSLINGKTALEFIPIVKILFPLVFGEWWFASTYFVLMLLTPFINILIKNLSKRLHQNLLILLIIIWSIIPTLTNQHMESNNLLWFIFLYMFAAYIKKYPIKLFNNQHLAILTFTLSTIYIILSIVLFDYMNLDVKKYYHYEYFYAKTKILPLFLQSISIFLIFKNINIKNSKVINLISSTMFGVYLIHDSNYLRPILWRTIFKNKLYQTSNFLVIHSLLTILIVFVSCIMISLIYNLTLKKLFSYIYDKNIKKTNSSNIDKQN